MGLSQQRHHDHQKLDFQDGATKRRGQQRADRGYTEERLAKRR
jgi:hypothetical protein